MKLKVIAYARNGHTDKFGIPRQSRDESPIVTRIVFEPEYCVREAVRGLEGFSHLWLIWGFSEVQRDDVQGTKEWSPTVRPPRLGGNKRVGVFATRSPFRPNPLGLSSVRLIRIQYSEVSRQMELIVSGADLMDGTPIYDIKPYLSYSDSHEDAKNGFAEATKDYHLEVVWESWSRETLDIHRSFIGNSSDIHSITLRDEIEYILSQDPRPAYQDDPDREYKMDFGGWRVVFKVEKSTIFVKKLEKI